MNDGNHEFEDRKVGKRLAHIRASFGFSQRQLAKRSGVANATVSQIESGRLNPTIGTLRKVLSGLPVSLSEFFDDSEVLEDEKIFFSRQELTEISKGRVTYAQVGRSLADKAIQLLWERYEPGADTGRHPLTHHGEECGFIIRGELVVEVSGNKKTLKAGDAYYFKSDKPHSFRNEGETACELITASTPPTF